MESTCLSAESMLGMICPRGHPVGQVPYQHLDHVTFPNFFILTREYHVYDFSIHGYQPFMDIGYKLRRHNPFDFGRSLWSRRLNFDTQ